MLRWLSPTWSWTKRCVRAGGVLVLAAALMAGCEPPDEKEEEISGGEPHETPAPRKSADKPMSPVRIWRDEAAIAGVPDDSIVLVAELLLQAVPQAQTPVPPERVDQFAEALYAFLTGETECFNEALAASHPAYVDRSWLVKGKAYWTAWLLAEAVKRPIMTPARSGEIRLDFESLVSAVADVVGPERGAKVRAQLTEQFATLHGDVLFPALKEPLTASMRLSLVTAATARPKASAHELATHVLFELAFEAVGPRLTEYWGHMQVEDYGPQKRRWPISISFVPDAAMNKARNWRRGGAAAPAARTRPAATKPARPSTRVAASRPETRPARKAPEGAPAGTVDSDWSSPVNGLRGWLSVGPYVAKRLDVQVALRLWNVTGGQIELDTAFVDSLEFKLTDASGSKVGPLASPASSEPAKWEYVQPGRSTGKIVGRSASRGSGHVLDLGVATWPLKPGKYQLGCTLKVDAAAAGKRKAAWTGRITLKNAKFEVFGVVDDEKLAKDVARVKEKHALDPKAAFWGALAELVQPGMTPGQMAAALQPAKGKPKIEDHGSYFFISYALDDEFSVKAVGLMRQGLRILTSRPIVLGGRTPPGPVKPAPATAPAK